MKPTAVHLTVILMVAGMYSCITKDRSETHIPENNVLPQTPVKEEKAASAPRPDSPKHSQPKASKVKLSAPMVYTIEEKEASSSCLLIAVPQLTEEDLSDSIVFTKVEIEAEYPGGAAAWQRFLNRNLRYPEEDIDNGIPGSAVVQFVVDKEGNVSNVEAVSGSAALGAELVRIIKKSGKWTPAVQDGRQVKSLKKLPLMIHPEVEE